MGCCYSCFNCLRIVEDKFENGDVNERTTLLGNPVSNNHTFNRPLYSGDAYHTEVPVTQGGDEQSALNRILQKTACDVIDVSAIPTHLERKEYLYRVRLYEQKLQNIQSQFVPSETRSILKDLAYPEKMLSENPLTFADLKMVGECFVDVQKSLQSVKIQPNTDLVAQFGSS